MNNKNSSIYILGSTGDLGMALSLNLSSISPVSVLRKGSKRKFFYRSGDIPRQLLEVDTYFDTDFLKNIVKNADIILNMAGMVSLNYSPEAASSVFLLNSFFPGLLTHLSKNKQLTFVFASTQRIDNIKNKQQREWIEKLVSLFDASKENLLEENFFENKALQIIQKFLKKNPLPLKSNVYELSKAVGETLVARHPSTKILRISSCYGPTCSTRRTIGRLALSAFLHQSRSESAETRDYLYIDDFVSVIRSIVEKPTTIPFIEYLVSGHSVSKEDIINGITCYLPEASQFLSTIMKNSPESFNASNSWVKKILAAEPTTPIEGIGPTIAFMQANYFGSEDIAAIRKMFAVYDSLKQRVDEVGTSIQKINHIKETFFQKRASEWIPHPSFYRPTGLVLGYPFPARFRKEISKFRTQLISELKEANPNLEYWLPPLEDLHTTIVSYSHYSEVGLDVIPLPETQFTNAKQIVNQYSPLEMIYEGIILLEDGSILIKGYPCGDQLDALRTELREGIDNITQKAQTLAHIKIGQILSGVTFNSVEKINSTYGFVHLGHLSFRFVTAPNHNKFFFSRR